MRRVYEKQSRFPMSSARTQRGRYTYCAAVVSNQTSDVFGLERMTIYDRANAEDSKFRKGMEL